MDKNQLVLPEEEPKIIDFNKGYRIYSTTLYGDNRYRCTIYIAAVSLQMANYYWRNNWELTKLRRSFNETCYYSLSQLCDNFSQLDTSERELFKKNNSHVLIFEGETI